MLYLNRVRFLLAHERRPIVYIRGLFDYSFYLLLPKS